MKVLEPLLTKNKAWAESIEKDNPGFFQTLSEQQNPDYLWIGCSDSRVPANDIVGMLPGELFVHRNVANQVIQTDLNCLSVLEYAVFSLGVKHIIVCGHYGCGGVHAAMKGNKNGLVDNWLRTIRETYLNNRESVDALPDEASRCNHLCELNVKAQVHNVCRTTIVQDAWNDGKELSVHGLIYGLSDGLLKNLDIGIHGPEDFAKHFGEF